MTRRTFAALATITALLPFRAKAQAAAADTSIRVTFGGFVDGYYAYDFGRPPSLDRGFTTQAARHNEFNVNLAYLEAVATGARVHGRLALQAGTSVQSNYAGEPTRGTNSGPSLARHMQEAFAGVRLRPTLWVDAGIFYSHMGLESWASRDNPVYTRSLTAEFSPYYSSGARAVWQATPKLTAQLHLVNGWQNISETNGDKSAGLRLDYARSSSTILSYYNFFDGQPGGLLRIFNGVGAKTTLSPRVQLLGEIDVGTQERATGAGRSTWYGFTGIARWMTSPTTALVGRIERFDDKDQVIIITGQPDPFRATGGSIGLDWMPFPHFMWRTEAKAFNGQRPVFADRSASGGLSKRDAVVVTSLSVWF
jgi:hypothetical protein